MQHIIEFVIVFFATFTITTSIMPLFILYFTNKKLGQMTREEGPQWHNVKAGTPTMGGVAFLIASVLVVVVMAFYKQTFNFNVLSLLLVLITFGGIGFLDDFLKLIRQHNEGLTSKQKSLGQFVFALIFSSVYIMLGEQTTLQLPLVNSLNSPILYFIFSVIWLVGFSNAVNLTDGLDGLVAGTASIALSAYAFIAYQQQKIEIVYFCVALIGGLVGFFLFNKKPAKIFMGDVGALALGAVFAVLSILLHVEWSLLLIGIVFVIETASVMLQVGSYKLRKKRIFKMSPLHHHFEMSGWSEWRVVLTFWAVGLMAALIYIVMFR